MAAGEHRPQEDGRQQWHRVAGMKPASRWPRGGSTSHWPVLIAPCGEDDRGELVADNRLGWPRELLSVAENGAGRMHSLPRHHRWHGLLQFWWERERERWGGVVGPTLARQQWAVRFGKAERRFSPKLPNFALESHLAILLELLPDNRFALPPAFSRKR